MVLPLIVMFLFVPMEADAKAPLMLVVERVTVSFVTTPLSAADVVSSKLVALVVASYTRLVTVMPVIVRVSAQMVADVVG